MKLIFCKNCGKRFTVASRDWKTGEVSEAERTGLCGLCKDHIRIEA